MAFTAEQSRSFEDWMNTSVASVVFVKPEARQQFILWLTQQNIPYRLNEQRGTIEIPDSHALDSVIVNFDTGEVAAKSSQNFLSVCVTWMFRLHPAEKSERS